MTDNCLPDFLAGYGYAGTEEQITNPFRDAYWYGAVGDGDGEGGGTDDQAALQDALDDLHADGGGRLLIRGPAIYRVDSTLTGYANIHIDMEDGAVLDFSNLTAGDIAIDFSGTFGSEANLSVSATRGDQSLTTSSAHGLVAEDWCLLMGQRDALGSLAAAEWRLGVTTSGSSPCYFAEPCQLTAAPTTTTMNLAEGLIFPTYNISADSGGSRVSTVKKINFMSGVKITGGKILLTGPSRTVASTAVRLNLCYMPVVDGVRFELGGLPGFGLRAMGCYRGDFTVSAFRTPGWTKGAINHSEFNSFKDIGCWYSSWDYWDYYGCQGLDVTYASGTTPYFPSLRPKITGGAINPLETGLTFHAGCYGGTIENFVAEGCPDTGLYLRSRGLTVVNPCISNATTNTGGAAGILFEGWGVDTSVIGGHIDGYTYGIKHNRTTSGTDGPAHMNISVSGTVFRLCNQAIRTVQAVTTPATSDPSGLKLNDLALIQCIDYGIYLDDYTNNVEIAHIHIDTLTGTGSSRGIRLPANAVGANISHVSGNDIGASNYLIDNSLAISDTTTFLPASYPTQGHRIDWPSIAVVGTGKLSTVTTAWCNQPTGNYTLLLSDANTTIYSQASTPCTITIPTESSVAMPVGAKIAVYQQGAGVVTFAGASGVTVSSNKSLNMTVPAGRAVLEKKSANSWFLSGDLMFTVPGEAPETAAYIDAMWVKPDSTRRALINTLIAGLITDGIWSSLDWFCLLAAHDSQAGLINARNPAKVLAAAGSPAFTVDRGYTGDGTAAYLDLQETFTATGNSLSLNSATVGLWCNQQNGAAGAIYQMGTQSGAALFTVQGNSSGNELFRVCDATSDTARSGSTGRTGHRASIRTGSAVKRAFYNGTRTANLTTASTATASGNGCILRHGSTYSPDRFAAAYSGAGLSDTLAASLHSRLNTYLTAIGAN